jgi:hypothetical protein
MARRKRKGGGAKAKQGTELDEDQLEAVAGGLLPAVSGDPARAAKIELSSLKAGANEVLMETVVLKR